MPSRPEVVLTTRRARWRAPGGAWTAGRLRLTDRRLVLLAPDGGSAVDLALAELGEVRMRRLPRAVIVLVPASGPLHLRCFEPAAVADLLRDARR